MRGGILGGRELLDKVASKVKEIIRGDLKAIIVFGSMIYLGRGRDVDLIIVVGGENDVRSKLEMEHKLRRVLQKEIPGLVFDVHVFSLEEFKENLKPGTMLSGLALGYEVVEGGDVVEPLILNFLKELSREKYMLHNKYGSWNISFHAKITYKLRQRRYQAKT